MSDAAETMPWEAPPRPGEFVPVDDVGEIHRRVPRNQSPEVRLAALEQQLPEAIGMGKTIVDHEAKLNELAQAYHHLAVQRGTAELQMERNTRVVAMQLAIQAASKKDDEAPSPIVITGLAEAFLVWLRAGTS